MNRRFRVHYGLSVHKRSTQAERQRSTPNAERVGYALTFG